MNKSLLSTSISLALLLPLSSIAQEQQNTAPKADTSKIESITVTAQYREATLLETGLAIDAVNSGTIEKQGITSAQDLSTLVPALTITTGAGISSQVFMRGVGNQSNNDFLDPAIILTYDGVALARGSANSVAAFYDIDRVEVLKGPQGTLYGKNATGGVLNIIPKKPKLDETSGFVNLEVGNYNSLNLSGALNLPLGENSALRLAASKNSRDGYNNDGTKDDDRTSFRLQFLSQVSEDFTFRIAVDSTDIAGKGTSSTPIGKYNPSSFEFIPNELPKNEGSSTEAANDYRNTILSAPGFGFLNDIDNDEQFIDATLKGINAEFTYFYGDDTTITFIPAWRKTEQSSKFVGPGFNLGWFQSNAEQTSLELRLTSSIGSDIEYIAGIFKFDEELEGNNTFNQEFVIPLQEYVQTGDSIAIFGEATWHVNDEFRLIVGARYTDDHKEIDAQIDNYITSCGGIGPNLITPPNSFAQGCHVEGNLPHFPTFDTPEQADAWLINEGWVASAGRVMPLINGVGQILHTTVVNKSEYSDSEPTYKISSEWDVTYNTMLYLSYTKGYRSGGLQPSSVSQYESEYLDAITFGSNNLFLNETLQLKTELFYWDYQDQQITYFNINEQNVLANTTDNVGAATSKGFDVDVIYKPIESLTLNSKIQYLKATYDDLFFTTSPPRHNINCPSKTIGSMANGTPVFEFNCSNNQSIFSPEWVVQLGADYVFEMDLMNISLSIDSTWVDDQVSGFFNLDHEIVESYTKTNAYISLDSLDDTWSVRFYARNLENKNRKQSTQSPLLGLAGASYGPDMTYGMSVKYNF